MNSGRAKIKLNGNTIYSIYTNSKDTRVKHENINTNSIFRKVTMPVILKNIIVICVIGIIGVWVYTYIEKEEVSYVESLSNNYIVGKVQFVGKSIDKINVKLVKSNIPVNKKDIVVKVNSGTTYLLKKGYNKEVRISVDQLKLGDTITIYCKENSLNGSGNEITARKIIKKES